MSLPRYPSLWIADNCWPAYKDGRLLDSSMDGAESERLLWKGTRIDRLTLIHPYINTSTDVTLLFSFYAANERTPFELEFRGEIITCKFVARPKAIEARGWWTTMSSSLRGV